MALPSINIYRLFSSPCALCDDSEIYKQRAFFSSLFSGQWVLRLAAGVGATVHLVLFSRLVSSVRVTKATKKNQFAFARCPCASVLHRCSRLDSVFIFASCDC